MAEYTIELRDVLESRPNIFDFPYNFYDERKKPEFEKDFCRHFYFREIGVDTVDRFVLNLEDKMKLVFPYYNKLMETAQIEYNVTDNYYMKETTTTTRDTESNTNGESYTVGQLFDEQTTSNTENRNEDRTETGRGTSSNERNVNDTVVTDRSVDVDTINHEEVDGTTTSKKDGTVTTDNTVDNKFSDTPQGRLDLNDAKYLTELKQDKTHGTVGTDETVNNTNDQTKDETGTSATQEDVETTTVGRTYDEGSTTENVTGNTKGDTKSEGTFTGEQKSTSDNNTRMRTKGNQLEQIVHERRGNIGIDTDADMLQKHIKFQKVMTTIKQMFFDECEDLFMMVY